MEKECDIHQLFMAMPQTWQERSNRIAKEAACFFEAIVQADLYEEEEILYTPDEIEQAVLYHDIGFCEIQEVFCAAGRERVDEPARELWRHTIYGAEIIKRYRLSHSISEREMGVWRLAEEIAMGHHERWDGKGYPHGEVATAISLVSRITAIVDDYDRILREYESDTDAFSAVAMQKLEEGAGTVYDPRLVLIFKKVCYRSKKLTRHFLLEERREMADTQDESDRRECG